MKYKKGDHVKIKSKKWWEKQIKNYDNNIETEHVIFTETMAKECCGKIGTVVRVDDSDITLYLAFGPQLNNDWFEENWIEKKIDVHKTKLKQLKSEL